MLKYFRNLIDWAFDTAKSDGCVEIDKKEFYTALLLAHSRISLYAGPVACAVSNCCFQGGDFTILKSSQMLEHCFGLSSFLKPISHASADEIFNRVDMNSTRRINREKT